MVTATDLRHQLDYSAGLPSRRTLWRLRFALVLVMLVAAGGVVLYQAGLITPRLEPQLTPGWGSEWGPGHVGYVFRVENRGWTPVTIVSYGRSLPGLELQPSPHGLLPLTLRPGQKIELTIEYKVTDCAAFDRIFPVAVDVTGFLGPRTGYVRAPDFDQTQCQPG